MFTWVCLVSCLITNFPPGTAFAAPYRFWHVVSSLSFISGVFVLLGFLVETRLFSSVSSRRICDFFLQFSFAVDSQLHTIVVSGKMLRVRSVFLNSLRLVSWPHVCSPLENVPCALDKNVFSAGLGQNVLCRAVECIWANVSFKATVSLSVFCLEALPAGAGGLLVSPELLCCYRFLFLGLLYFLSMSRCTSVGDINIYKPPCWMNPFVISNAHLCLLLWTLFWRLRSDVSAATPAFSGFPPARSISSHPFAFSPRVLMPVCPDLSQAAYRRVLFSAWIHSATLCLLDGESSPFTLKGLTDSCVLIAIFFRVLQLFVFPLLLFLLSSLVVRCLSSVLCLDFYLMYTCVSATGFDLWLPYGSHASAYRHTSRLLGVRS